MASQAEAIPLAREACSGFGAWTPPTNIQTHAYWKDERLGASCSGNPVECNDSSSCFGQNFCLSLKKAEAGIRDASSWNDAYTATLDATELCLQALKLSADAHEKQLLDEKCRKLLDQAERLKTSEEGPPIRNGSLGIRGHNFKDVSTKPLKQPISTRKLSTREQIILLQGSKLHGCIFPPWKDPPAPEEFALTGAELFT